MKRLSLPILSMTLLTITPLLTFCSHIERRWASQQRPLEMDSVDDRKAYHRSQIKEELGWEGKEELSDAQEYRLDLRQKLKEAERQLITQKEKIQYYGIKGQLKNDSERLQFLRLPNMEVREKWTREKGYSSNQEGFSDELADLIEKKDLALKMPKKAVLESWGDPEQIEIAGNPMYGFERWRYTKFESSDEGFKRIERIVYFESGVVVGWETLAKD